MNRKIYSLSSYTQIIKEFDKLNFKEKYQLINYLIIVDNNNKAFELLKRIYKSKLSKRKIEKLNYLQLIYYINNEDKYNRDAIKYKLTRRNEKDKQYYNLICEENLEKRLKIFEEIVKNNKIHRYFRNKKYRSNIIYTYLMNFGMLDDPINIKYIDKFIINNLKKLNRKKHLTIFEINHVENISNIIFSNLSFVYIKNNEYFMDFFEYRKLLEKVIFERERFKDFSKEKNIQFNTIMYIAIRDLINLDEFSNEEKEEMTEYINNFFNENIDNIDENIKISKAAYNGEFWEELEKIVEANNEEINLTDLIMTTACCNYKKINETYNKLNIVIDKYSNKVSDNIREELFLSREILNLWVNGVFNKNSIHRKYKISDFTKLIIDFFNGELPQEDFIFELNNINKIDCFEILNWNILEEKCKVFGNLEWLSMILDKINVQFDDKASEYFEHFYINISQEERTVFLKDFLNISNKLIKKFDYNYMFLLNTTNILIQFYADFKDAEKLIEQIINNWEKIKIKNKEVYFLSILVVIVEQNMIKINFKKVKDIIKNIKIGINKQFMLLYVSIIDHSIVISEKEYKEILKFIIDVFKNQDNIEDNFYRIIASLAMKYEENNNILQLPQYDLIYYRDNKHYYKKTDDPLLKESYKLLPLEETDNVNDAKEEHVLMFLICRIFFEKIEEKGLGKKFTLTANAGAKELMDQLNKALGVDVRINERKQIREGKIIDVPWMNIYDYSSILEDIVSLKWNMFYNSKNKRFLSENKIIHISTAILLERIGRLDVLEKNRCYISYSIYEETIKRSNKEIIELGRGITEEAVFYDAELDKLATSLRKIEKEERIYSVTKAKIVPRSGLNVFDDEMIKYIIDSINENKNFCLITEDPYWLTLEPFSNISEGTVSLIIDSYKNNIISSKDFYESIVKLNDIKYNLDIGNALLSYLLLKSEDEYIKESIKIINNYKINKS